MVDVPLGTLIFRAGLLAEEQLEDALQDGMRTGKRLGEVLLERGWLHERDLGRLLAGQKGLPFVEVRGSDAEPAALQLLPEDKARLQIALPLRHEDGQLVVAVADPSNELVVENLRRALGSEPQLVVAAQGDLIRAINEAYAPQAVVVAPSAEHPVPEAQPLPSLQVEIEPPATVEAPAPIEAPAPVAAPARAAVAAAPTPMPTVLPPAEERAAEPEVAPLQPLLPEPSALGVEQHPIATPVAPSVEQPVPAPLSEPPPAQPEPVLAADPAPLLQVPAPAPEPDQTPAPLLPLVESNETQTPVAEAPSAPELQPDVAPPPLPVEQPVETAAAPEPLAEQVEVPPPMVSAEPDPASTSIHAVLIRLREGDVLEVGTFPTAAEAAARAQDVVRQIAAAEGEATWPFFGERYLRPDAIVSVDLREDSAGQWLGSPVRSHWAEQS